jgi:hypothetical protein
MAVCLLFRKKFYGMKDNNHSKLSGLVVSGLRQADALVQAGRPALLPSIQTGIDRAAAPQIRWLRKQWGLEFKSYDYSHLNHDSKSGEIEALDRVKSLDQIIHMDFDVIKNVAHVLATQTRVADVPTVAKWSAALASYSHSEILSLLAA